MTEIERFYTRDKNLFIGERKRERISLKDMENKTERYVMKLIKPGERENNIAIE